MRLSTPHCAASRLASGWWCAWAASLALAAATGCSDKPKPQAEPADTLRVDEKAGTVALPAVVAKQQTYKVLKGAIEYLLVGKGGKQYETVFVTEVRPDEIVRALARIGLRPGMPAEEDLPPRGQPVEMFVEYRSGEKTIRRPLDECVLRVQRAGPTARTQPRSPAPAESATPLRPAAWPFTGSKETLDPETNRRILQAALTQSIIGLHYSDASALFQNPRPECRRENIYRANAEALPAAGTGVRILFRPVRRRVPERTRRAHVRIGGRVQGVGFLTFTAGQARRLKLTGFVRALPDRQVETVVEGPADGVRELLVKLRRGPRAARVESFQAEEETPLGDFDTFEIWY